MPGNFNKPPAKTPDASPAQDPTQEKEGLIALFEEAEKIFAAEGREGAKPFLPKLYTGLQKLNKSDVSDWQKVWTWNPEGSLTQEEFDALNLRRKKLSNDIGILTAGGTIRHDLNEI